MLVIKLLNLSLLENFKLKKLVLVEPCLHLNAQVTFWNLNLGGGRRLRRSTAERTRTTRA